MVLVSQMAYNSHRLGKPSHASTVSCPVAAPSPLATRAGAPVLDVVFAWNPVMGPLGGLLSPSIVCLRTACVVAGVRAE